MARKTTFILGFGVGYVLGARAGRQRYEDIIRLWHQLTGSPTVQRAAGRTKDAASEGARKGLSVVQHGVEKAGTAVRSRLQRDGSETDEVIDRLEERLGEGTSSKPGPGSAGKSGGRPTKQELGT